MKVKKSFFLFIILISVFALSLSPPTVSSARANGLYQRVITEDTPFFSSTDDSAPLFYLPYTYYVKVLGEKNGFVHVECYGTGLTAALDGYVPSGYLFEDGLAVSSPYVVLSLTTADTAVLYADADLKQSLQYVFKDREMQYYGALPTDDGMIYYVGYNGRLGYIKESSVFPFAIPNHPNELTFIEPELPPETEPETPSNGTESAFDLRFAIIACLIFAGLVALFMVISKNKPQKAAASYYDENDYE